MSSSIENLSQLENGLKDTGSAPEQLLADALPQDNSNDLNSAASEQSEDKADLPTPSSSIHSTTTNPLEFNWKVSIPNKSSHIRDESPFFGPIGCAWKLYVHQRKDPSFIGLFIKPHLGTYARRATCKARAVNLDGVVADKRSTVTFAPAEESRGWARFFAVEDIRDPDDVLDVNVTIEVLNFDEVVRNYKKSYTKHDGRPIPKQPSLFLQDTLSDIKLDIREHGDSDVPDAILPAHKAILANASEYFLAMFSSGMRESNHGSTIKIIGYPVDIVKLMLQFIYLHVMPEENLDVDTCEELLRLADEYQLCQMAAWLSNYVLKNHLADSTVVNLWALGVLYEHNDGGILKEGCTKYVRDHCRVLWEQKEFRKGLEEANDVDELVAMMQELTH